MLCFLYFFYKFLDNETAFLKSNLIGRIDSLGKLPLFQNIIGEKSYNYLMKVCFIFCYLYWHLLISVCFFIIESDIK